MKKNWNRRLTIAAATFALGAAALYGQSRMTAKIPFEFHTGSGVYPAGSYSIVSNASGQVLLLRNETTLKTVNIGVGTPESQAEYQEIRPRLVFSCIDGGACALAQVWTADGLGHSYRIPKPKYLELSRLVVVYTGGNLAR